MVFTSLFGYLALYAGLLCAYVWVVFYLARQADDKESQTQAASKKSGSSFSPFGA
jgi:cytochrome d ubiquinol oxidase subunit I